MFGNIRMRHGFPTRRKKQRRDTLPLKVEKAGVVEDIEIPVGRHPAVTPIVFFEPCGILSGLVGPERPVLVRLLANEGVAPSDLGGDAIHVDVKPCVAELRRFLAKIAHCFTVLNLGLDGFSPWLVPLILRGEGDADALIGSDAVAPLEGARPDRSNVHQMLLRIYSTKTHGDVCVVHIGLFCNWFADGSADRMPSYHVVVGAATQRSWDRLQTPLFYPVLSQREIERGSYMLSDPLDMPT
ncbi:hypothetical protein [Sphingomonas nostoxanthinifaciens]|uniref:hypothetical protein n=1 Tax=Sphingomonas nostoxanthinifaciens TaxID=2872652 RepID=UPI001CC217B2|nr:hypothetical protein [Sphingomonas nostoxanthinifaciens]UAK25309.1 hypothetical protein K8P63_03730 [Sphingomonas nostoxanthinifaciens]